MFREKISRMLSTKLKRLNAQMTTVWQQQEPSIKTRSSEGKFHIDDDVGKMLCLGTLVDTLLKLYKRRNKTELALVICPRY